MWAHGFVFSSYFVDEVVYTDIAIFTMLMHVLHAFKNLLGSMCLIQENFLKVYSMYVHNQFNYVSALPADQYLCRLIFADN